MIPFWSLVRIKLRRALLFFTHTERQRREWERRAIAEWDRVAPGKADRRPWWRKLLDYRGDRQKFERMIAGHERLAAVDRDLERKATSVYDDQYETWEQGFYAMPDFRPPPDLDRIREELDRDEFEPARRRVREQYGLRDDADVMQLFAQAGQSVEMRFDFKVSDKPEPAR